VVLSHFADIFERFREQADSLFPSIRKVLVVDGNQIQPPKDWLVLKGHEPFSLSRNSNMAWRAVDPDDVLIIGDDVIVVTSNLIDVLQKAAYSDPLVGLAIPTIEEGKWQSAFVCAYLKRSVINHVGYYDEQFNGYGYDDNDLSQRLRVAGYYTKRTNAIIQHCGGTTYYRVEHEGGPNVQESCDRMREKFNAKWPAAEPLQCVED